MPMPVRSRMGRPGTPALSLHAASHLHLANSPLATPPPVRRLLRRPSRTRPGAQPPRRARPRRQVRRPAARPWPAAARPWPPSAARPCQGRRAAGGTRPCPGPPRPPAFQGRRSAGRHRRPAIRFAVEIMYAAWTFKIHEFISVFQATEDARKVAEEERALALAEIEKARAAIEKVWQNGSYFWHCKRCGVYEEDTFKPADVFDEWEMCSGDFKDGKYTRLKENQFNATFICSNCTTSAVKTLKTNWALAMNSKSVRTVSAGYNRYFEM